MKNKTQGTVVPMVIAPKKVQLNARIPAALKLAVADLAAKTQCSHETIVADALSQFLIRSGTSHTAPDGRCQAVMADDDDSIWLLNP